MARRSKKPAKPQTFTTPAFHQVDREPDPRDHRGIATRLVARTDVATLLRWGREPTWDDKNDGVARMKQRSLESRTSWYGADTADAITNLLDWPEARRLADAHRRTLPDVRPPEIKRVRRFRDDGDEFDRDRFDAGLEDCWQTRVRERVPGRGPITLTVQVGGACSVSARDLAWTGAAAMAVVDAAEAAGIRVEVKAISSSANTFTGLSDDLHVVVDVKGASDPIDPASLAVAMACPAFFRWQVIGSFLTLPWKVATSFGHVVRVPDDLRGDLHLNQARSQREAAAEVSRLVARIEQLAAGTALAA